MFCYYCHCEREGNFCWFCGWRLAGSSKIECGCGKTVDFLDFYCSNCGKQVTADWVVPKEEVDYAKSIGEKVES